MHPYLASVLDIVTRRNHTEKEFLQAVTEVLPSLEPLIEEHPELEQENVLERITEPERQLVFRIVWEDDAGKVHVNRGFRVGFSSVLGPYKGGLRFHPTVSLSVIKFLGFEQIFKNSLTGLSLGGGKGGSDFDPRGRTDHEVMRFCQAFMTSLYQYIGSSSDVPAGDIGVSGREIGYLFGQYKRLTNRYEMGVLTGKDTRHGGSQARTEATGFGCVYFAQNMLQTRGDDFTDKVCVVSGSGNVALYAIRKLQQLGAKVVACSDSGGVIYDPAGIDFDTVRMIKEVERARILKYVEIRPKAEYKAGAQVWDIACDCAFPCATQNEIDEKAAQTLVDNGCKLVCEGANMPSTPEAIEIYKKHGLLFGPAKAANAGGVAVSALEMQQNAGLERWTFAAVDERLQTIMKEIHDNCIHNATKYATPDDYATGANIAGFLRVAQGMVAHGHV